MKDETLSLILSEKNNRNTIIVATEINSGEQIIINEKNDTDINNKILIAAKNNIIQGKSEILEIESNKWFLNITLPPLRLITVGAVHIAQPLAEIATISGYEVIIIDPRAAFANNQRFPDIKIINKWPDEAFKEIETNESSALIALTHDPKIDDPALQHALNKKFYYIGALGSKKTHENRCERLKEAGFNSEQINSIHGPIGIKLGGRSAPEIALSIIAQLVSETYKK